MCSIGEHQPLPNAARGPRYRVCKIQLSSDCMHRPWPWWRNSQTYPSADCAIALSCFSLPCSVLHIHWFAGLCSVIYSPAESVLRGTVGQCWDQDRWQRDQDRWHRDQDRWLRDQDRWHSSETWTGGSETRTGGTVLKPGQVAQRQGRVVQCWDKDGWYSVETRTGGTVLRQGRVVQCWDKDGCYTTCATVLRRG